MKKIVIKEDIFHKLFEVNTNKTLDKKNNDSIYTHIDEITEELKHYYDELKDKVVYCNCDDEESAFYQYFIQNFNNIGLKYLHCTSMRQGGIYRI